MSVSNHLRPLQVLLVLIALDGWPASAAEIAGKVVAVAGDTVKIKPQGDLQPRTGDAVRISFEVPNVGEVPLEGEWRVTSIEGGLVVAVAQGAVSGKPQIDYRAMIISSASVVVSNERPGNEIPTRGRPAEDAATAKLAASARKAFEEGRTVGAHRDIRSLQTRVRELWVKQVDELRPRAPQGWMAVEASDGLTSSGEQGIVCTWGFSRGERSTVSVRVNLNPNPGDMPGVGSDPWLKEGLVAPGSNQQVVTVAGRKALLEYDPARRSGGIGLWLVDGGILCVEGQGVDRGELSETFARDVNLAGVDAVAARGVSGSGARELFAELEPAVREGKHGIAYVVCGRLAVKLSDMATPKLQSVLPKALAGWSSGSPERSGLASELYVWVTFTRDPRQELIVSVYSAGGLNDEKRLEALRRAPGGQADGEVVTFAGRRGLWDGRDLYLYLDDGRFGLKVDPHGLDARAWFTQVGGAIDPASMETVLSAIR